MILQEMKTEKTKNYIMQYVIYTYGLFGLLLITLGGIATVLLHGTPLVMEWLTAITAWTPTYVFLIMFKKLYLDSKIKDFYKKMFLIEN
jgi:cytochrome c-type biogenesis protein CcmH/NrfF